MVLIQLISKLWPKPHINIFAKANTDVSSIFAHNDVINYLKAEKMW